MKKYILLSVSTLLLGVSIVFIKNINDSKKLSELEKNIVLNEKRMDFLLKNHNCKLNYIKQLEVELRHYQIRKSKLQKFSGVASAMIDVDGTINEIKKECKI